MAKVILDTLIAAPVSQKFDDLGGIVISKPTAGLELSSYVSHDLIHQSTELQGAIDLSYIKLSVDGNDISDISTELEFVTQIELTSVQDAISIQGVTVSSVGPTYSGDGSILVFNESTGELEYRLFQYVHTESPASSLWTINHDLDRFPQVTITDISGEDEYEADVSYTDSNNIEICFNSPFEGKAYLT